MANRSTKEVKYAQPQARATQGVQRDAKKGCLLLELVQQQEHQVEVKMAGEEVERLHGSVDEVQWTDLKLACSAVCNALARAGVTDTSEVLTDIWFVRMARGWSPAIELWWTRPDVEDEAVQFAVDIAQEALLGLFQDPQHPNGDLFGAKLPEETRRAVSTVVHEMLATAGGRRIQNPVEVHAPDMAPRVFSGKLAPKPSKASFEPVPVQLTGHVRGFLNDHAKRLIYFHSRDGEAVEIAFDPNLLGQSLDLVSLAQWNVLGQPCLVQAHQTVSASGARQFTLVRIGAAEDSADSASAT